ncbi:MAG: transporter, partial [candidate division KSB1 bacterium]|nr:transporter [candidate division KSB1 bacterium]
MKRKAVGALLLVATLSMSAQAQHLNGARGLPYVRAAWVMEPGYLTMYAHSRFFGKVGHVSLGRITSAVTYWDVQGTLYFTYGISRHIEASVSPIIYQDTNKGTPGYNIPDDIFLSVKFGSYGSKGSSFSYGLAANGRIPTGKYHNLVFEPYSAGTWEWGFTALASYTLDPLYPEEAFNIHLNLNYNHHNDVGEKLSLAPDLVDTIRVLSPTQTLNYALGLRYPADKFDYWIQLFGTKFLRQPPITAYSREDFTYLSPGVTYKPYPWLSFDVCVDVRLSKDKDETVYAFYGVHKIAEMPNYAGWRVNVGMHLTILPTSVYKVTERDLLMRKAESRRQLFEQMIREQRETESAEQELERIKEERRKAERELERLRSILEQEARKRQEEQQKKQQQ